jgi:signal transduction histidine kinase
MKFKLRTRMLAFLFIFALLPLMAAVIINLPLVLDRVELFYSQAILQNLRADFADLDKHLTSRDEMIRLLAKLSEPGLAIGDNSSHSESINMQRLGYAEWINRILQDQLDIVDILFMDTAAVSRFWLSRDSQNQVWEPSSVQPRRPPLDYLAPVLEAKNMFVALTPVNVDQQASTPSRAITLQMLAPLGPSENKATYGAVVITVDIGGLVRRDDNTLWVHDDGRYLKAPGVPAHTQSAFSEFPGLEEDFKSEDIVLWEGEDGRVIWVPLLRTEDDKPLWVGRRIQNDPLQAMRDALIVRVLSIILVLILVIWVMARWIASRLETYGSELFQGIRTLLNQGEPVKFKWKGSPELEQLARDLSILSETHARNTRNLQVHAQELEASNRYQAEFLANVSHELRTPLNSILLLSKLLAEGKEGLDTEQRKQVQVIHDASADLRALIDNVLDLSRIEAGGLEPHIETVQLPRLLRDLISLMQPQVSARGLRLQLYIEVDVATEIRTDVDKLRQILKNFLSNAVKFTNEGQIWVRLEQADAPYLVKLSVVDSGIGIPQDKQEIIFEAFKQADGSTRRRYGGTGLGLSISSELADILCGEIRLDSEEGRGACFSLLLPFECGERESIPATEQRAVELPSMTTETPTLPLADYAGHRMLLVEQDIHQLLLLSQMLETWGIEVFAAGDGDEVRETLMDETDVEVILISSDVAGYDTLAGSLQWGSESGRLVIGLGFEEGSLPVGMDKALAVPVNPVTLRDMLEEYFFHRAP